MPPSELTSLVRPSTQTSDWEIIVAGPYETGNAEAEENENIE